MKHLVAGFALSVSLAPGAAPLLVQAAQAPAAATSFEVASVKPSAVDSTSPIGMIPRIVPAGVGRFSASNVTLRLLLLMAFRFQDFQIVGGPSWQTSKRFDILAKAEDGYTGGNNEMQAMLQALLVERFGLKSHYEKREMPISVLVLAHGDGRLGPELKPSASTCPDPQAQAQRTANMEKARDLMAKGDANAAMALMRAGTNCSITPVPSTPGTMTMGIKANGQPISMIAQFVQQMTGRLVQDRTGLTGLYDFALELDMQSPLAMAAPLGISLPAGVNLPPSNGPSLLTALQEQLGLKVNTERGMVDVLVIDAAEEPAPN